MPYKIQPPYYPVVYVRGYAMTENEREETFHDTYYGFAATSVEKRQAPPPCFTRTARPRTCTKSPDHAAKSMNG